MMVRPGYAVYPTLVLCYFVIFPPVILGDAPAYEGKNIARIVFVPREQPLDPEELHRILPVKEQTPLHLDDVRAAIDRLFATGTYSDIQVDAESSKDDVIQLFCVMNRRMTSSLLDSPTSRWTQNPAKTTSSCGSSRKTTGSSDAFQCQARSRNRPTRANWRTPAGWSLAS